MAKVTVELVSESEEAAGKIKLVQNGQTKIINLRALDKRQKEYFEKAYAAFLQNPSCWDFDGPWILDCDSILPATLRDIISTEDLVATRHLMGALVELWIALGVNQGQMTSSSDLTVYILI